MSCCAEYKPVIYKTARRRPASCSASCVVVATIQSLMTDRRYREEFTPFHFDLVINDEAHRSIYGDAREVVQFFQATRIGLTATPKAYLKNINIEELGEENPKALEARQLRDTYHYFGCEPGVPTFRYDIIDAVKDPEGPFLCLPKIFDIRSDITTKALAEYGWAVVINEQEENFKIQDLERKIFTPARNRVMCEAFLAASPEGPDRHDRQVHHLRRQPDARDQPDQDLQRLAARIAVTITSRIPEASSIAKEFRDGKRAERVAVSVDMLSTGYNCRDLLNIVLMRPIFSPTEYIQIKGRGTRLLHLPHRQHRVREEIFLHARFLRCRRILRGEVRLLLAAETAASRRRSRRQRPGRPAGSSGGERHRTRAEPAPKPRAATHEFPFGKGTDTVVSREEVRIVGPNGEKVDVMTFRGSFERDIKEFVAQRRRASRRPSRPRTTTRSRPSSTSGSTTGRRCSTRRTSSSCPTACRRRRRPSCTTRSAGSPLPTASDRHRHRGFHRRALQPSLQRAEVARRHRPA